MQSERPTLLSRKLRIAAAATSVDLYANDSIKLDTRRFGTIFTPIVPDTIVANCGDAIINEQRDENSEDHSRTPNSNVSTGQGDSVETAGQSQSSALSAAQQVVADYRAIHRNDPPSECATAGVAEKELPELPDDERSMYTLAPPRSPQSPIDMMWKPQPKVHMHRNDQQALMQAQSEAVSMMRDAGLKPTNKIQCRRHGCADILPDVEALKYHLHIHNIADSASEFSNASPSALHKASLAGCSTPDSKPSKTTQSRSKSSLSAQHKHLTIRPPSRKPSAGSLLPSIFSPRDSSPEVQLVPSSTAVTNAFVPSPSPNKSSGPLSTRNSHVTPSRGRRTRKESTGISVDSECNPSIAMLLSPPSSPTKRNHQASPPQTNLPVLLMVNPVTIDEREHCIFVPSEDVHSVPEKLTRARGPTRALSPTRAMSPIRNGIRRVLTIGRPDDFTNE